MPITATNHRSGLERSASQFLSDSPSVILLNVVTSVNEESTIPEIIATEVVATSGIYLPQTYTATGTWNASANTYTLASTTYTFAPVGGSLVYTHIALWVGRSLVPYKIISSIDTASNRITSTAHGYVDGDRIVVTAAGSMPGGLDSTVRYWANAIDADTLELHTNSGLSAIADITSVGSGEILLRNANGNCKHIANTGGVRTIPGGGSGTVTLDSITYT